MAVKKRTGFALLSILCLTVLVLVKQQSFINKDIEWRPNIYERHNAKVESALDMQERNKSNARKNGDSDSHKSRNVGDVSVTDKTKNVPNVVNGNSTMALDYKKSIDIKNITVSTMKKQNHIDSIKNTIKASKSKNVTETAIKVGQDNVATKKPNNITVIEKEVAAKEDNVTGKEKTASVNDQECQEDIGKNTTAAIMTKIVPPVNPGCAAKKVSQYVAPDTGKTYDHPNIVHFAKFSKSKNKTKVMLNFREYISVLSIYKFLKPNRLIFHTFTNFSGHYWEKIKSLKDIPLEVNVIPLISKIGGKPVKFVEHKADFVKLSMVYKYGGTALDFDVIMINGSRWKSLERRSECVLVEENKLVNGGLYSCIQNSPYIAKWLEGYHKKYSPNSWLYNASEMPANLLKGKVCYNVHVDRTVCLNPTYSDRDRWLKEDKAAWRQKTAAHYYVKSGIPNDGEGLLKEKFSLATLVQYVNNA